MISPTIWRVTRITFGVSCLGLGVAGLFLPFLQGILLIVVGLTVLSRDSRHAHQALTWLRTRVHSQKRRDQAAEAPEGVDDAR